MKPERAKRLLPVACAAGVVLILAAALWWHPPLWQTDYSPLTGEPFARLEAGDRVNVNTAGPQQLCLLPGIGESKAQAIIDHREENGPFATLADLEAVPGIGPGITAKLEGLVSF